MTLLLTILTGVDSSLTNERQVLTAADVIPEEVLNVVTMRIDVELVCERHAIDVNICTLVMHVRRLNSDVIGWKT